MIYIYDILLNWSDISQYYDFYEWEKTDKIEHIKRIPLIKISSESLNDIYNHKIKMEDTLLKKIRDATEIYKNKKIEKITYACVLCDGNRSLATIFDEKGNIKTHSKLLLDEEDDVIDLVSRLEFTEIQYKKEIKQVNQSFYTRKELEKKEYLLGEFDSAYHQRNKEKLLYLYQEYFGKIAEELNTMYQDLRKSLNTFTDKHNELYELLKLSHTKKNV